MGGTGSALAKAWQATLEFIKWAAPAFKEGMLVWSGRLWQSLLYATADSKTLLEQLNEIQKADKANDARPVAGAADRLQQSAWARRKHNPPT